MGIGLFCGRTVLIGCVKCGCGQRGRSKISKLSWKSYVHGPFLCCADANSVFRRSAGSPQTEPAGASLSFGDYSIAVLVNFVALYLSALLR